MTESVFIVYLASLATKPKHQGKGVGSMLLQWGTERADGAGLEIYLESTKEGKPLYEKFGFETVHIKEQELEKYGGRGKDKHWIMVRKPQMKKLN